MINVKTTVNMCSIVVNMCSIVVNVCRIVVSTPRGVSDLHSLNDLPVVVSGLEATRYTNNGLYVDVRRKTLLRKFV